MCGEQLQEVFPGADVKGSPPRVRGTDAHTVIRLRKSRITPACAGNSCPGGRFHYRDQDHPRVCGEQCYLSEQQWRYKGSPPRVRGTGLSVVAIHSDEGITPACAGNSPYFPAQLAFFWDHPRVCGEQNFCCTLLLSNLGSPPRVRGTAKLQSVLCRLSRITPACAGNSSADYRKHSDI